MPDRLDYIDCLTKLTAISRQFDCAIMETEWRMNVGITTRICFYRCEKTDNDNWQLHASFSVSHASRDKRTVAITPALITFGIEESCGHTIILLNYSRQPDLDQALNALNEQIKTVAKELERKLSSYIPPNDLVACAKHKGRQVSVKR